MFRPRDVVLVLALTLSAAPASAELQLTIVGGRVTLHAVEVRVQQILAEWARVGGTDIVNADEVTGEPVTLELHDVPEQQALGIVLRSVAGYMATMQPGAPTRSMYTRVIILARSTLPTPTATRRAPEPPPLAPVPDGGGPSVLPEDADGAAQANADVAGLAPAAGSGQSRRPAGQSPSSPTQRARSAPEKPLPPPTPMRPATLTPFGAVAGASAPGMAAPSAPAGYPAQVPVTTEP